MFLFEIIIALFAILLSLIFYFKRSYKYWENRNVPYIQPSIPWGTDEGPLKRTKNFSVAIKGFYDELKSKGNRFGGIYLFTKPALLAVHPDLVKHVLAQDFQHFIGRGIRVDEEKEPLSGNLFTLDGEKWRKMRTKLTPTFTSGKMKMMFHTLLVCGEPMVDHVATLSEQGKPLNIKEILACFTTDVIGSCAFGIDCNSFKNPDAEFRKYGRSIFEPSWKKQFSRMLSFISSRVGTSILEQEAKDFFFNTFRSIVTFREKSDVVRNDFVQLMLDIKRKAEENGSGDTLTVVQMTAQSFLFFLAGFETSSTTMTFCLFELAYNLDIQEKLRKEIIETLRKYDGKLTYDGIMEMKYLNMVIEEALRKYPPVPLMNRLCNKTYTIPETGTKVEAGTRVFISVLGLQRDSEYFPDPEKFDPERFSEENKARIYPFSYIPFGEGPRICIGLRFGLMQVKVGLSLLLKNYVFTPHESMSYGMEFHKNASILSFKNDLLLRAKKI